MPRITIRRTFDAAPIYVVLSDPALFDIFRDDIAGKEFDFSPLVSDHRNFFFVADDGDGPAGIIQFLSIEGGSYEGHIAFVSRVWGRGVAQEATRAAVSLMFDHVGANQIRTSIPRRRDCLPVTRLARQIGMVEVDSESPEREFVLTPKTFRR